MNTKSEGNFVQSLLRRKQVQKGQKYKGFSHKVFLGRRKMTSYDQQQMKVLQFQSQNIRETIEEDLDSQIFEYPLTIETIQLDKSPNRKIFKNVSFPQLNFSPLSYQQIQKKNSEIQEMQEWHQGIRIRTLAESRSVQELHPQKKEYQIGLETKERKQKKYFNSGEEEDILKSY